MKTGKLFSLLLAVIVLISAAIPALAADNEKTSPDFTLSEETVISPYAGTAVTASENQSGVATIESDPSRLTAPGYVTVTVKLRNTNGSSGQNSIISGLGSLSVKDDAPVISSAIGSIDSSDEVQPLLLPPIFTVPPSSTKPPAEATPTPVVTETPYQPTEEPLPTYTPTQQPIETNEPIITSAPTPTAIPQSGRFTHISITNPYGVSFQTNDVNPGTIGVFRATMMVYDSMIGQTLSFVISWYDTATNMTYSQNLGLVIQRSDSAYLRLSRTTNVTNAAIDDEVEFTYTFVNTGSRRLTNIRLTDDKILGNEEIAEPFSLASGERREIKYIYKMKSSSVVSKPTATFTPEGSTTQLSVTVSKMTIGLINAQLTKSVNIGTQTPEGVNFTLFLTNNGSQNLSGLSVKDDEDNVLASGFSLAIGESRILEHFVSNPETVRNVVFYITGTYDEGREFTDNTVSYTVRSYINPALLGLKFNAEVRKQLDSENNIGLTFTIENIGRLPYTNIVLTEQQLGYAIHEEHGLAASSEPVKFDVDLKLDEPRELVFILTALDPSGNEHTYDAYINAQQINVDPAIPNASPVPGSDTGTTIVDLNLDRQISEKGQELMKLWRVMRIIFVIALIAILLLALLEFYIYRRKKQQNS